MPVNIQFNLSKETYVDFNGNQYIKMELVLCQKPAIEKNLAENSDGKGSR